jgi:hypothetical protein
MPSCSVCGCDAPLSSFSKSQQRKSADVRKCKACSAVTDTVGPSGGAASASLDDTQSVGDRAAASAAAHTARTPTTEIVSAVGSEEADAPLDVTNLTAVTMVVMAMAQHKARFEGPPPFVNSSASVNIAAHILCSHFSPRCEWKQNIRCLDVQRVPCLTRYVSVVDHAASMCNACRVSRATCLLLITH